MLTAVMAAMPTLLLSARARGKDIIQEVNQRCIEKSIPQAFDVVSIEDAQGLDDVRFRCSPDFRFEGFGVDAGIPLKFTFWVWYKKGSPEAVEVGKFQVKMNILSDLALNLIPLGSIATLIDQVDDVVEVVENLTEAVNEVND
jgi:uncharacterized protein YqgV (UPF0045/DUF77 family)